MTLTTLMWDDLSEDWAKVRVGGRSKSCLVTSATGSPRGIRANKTNKCETEISLCHVKFSKEN